VRHQSAVRILALYALRARNGFRWWSNHTQHWVGSIGLTCGSSNVLSAASAVIVYSDIPREGQTERYVSGPVVWSAESINPMIIPHRLLSPEALRGVIEAFVTREGTDYGVHDVSLTTKVAQVRQQLDQGTAVLVYDEDTESVTIQPTNHIPDHS